MGHIYIYVCFAMLKKLNKMIIQQIKKPSASFDLVKNFR